VIKAIVDAFERSDWSEIDVSSGSLRIRLSTQPETVVGAAPIDLAPARGDDATDRDPVATRPKEPTVVPAVVPAGAHAVISPSPGIFWRAPLPGAPPFADVGDEVESGATLCIVEVMKLMNHISSSVTGTVVGVFVENGLRVDRGDTLFAIQPSMSP
jgi:acetyl-CoA carboxylase biotin carboxyl carrier protein